jgi:hypothetical protein
MVSFCKVDAEIRVNGEVVKSRSWPEVDIMKTGVTRAWTTRQFNRTLNDFASCDLGEHKVIRAEWIARYGEAQGHMSVSGWISGTKGRVMARRGVFEA